MSRKKQPSVSVRQLQQQVQRQVMEMLVWDDFWRQ